MIRAGDNLVRSDGVGAPPACGGERRMSPAGDNLVRSDGVGARPQRGDPHPLEEARRK
jgi:hypothetical protein